MIEWIINLPRNAKRIISLGADLVLLPLTLWASFCLRLDELYVPDTRIATVMGLTTFVTAILFTRLGLYRAVIRFASIQLLTTVFIGVSFSVLSLAFFSFLFQATMPRSIPFIYLGLGIIAIGGTRLFARALLNTDQRHANERVIIYGAGSAGLQLATALSQGIEYRPVAFVDDDKKKQGSILQGLRVHKPRRIKKILTDSGATLVLLAISNSTVQQKSHIMDVLSRFDVRVQTIPGFADIVSGKASIEEIRNIEIEELLGRDTVPPNHELLNKCVLNKVVMVTGAGGSIGSELCRQILDGNPKLLILYELSEFALYTIEKEINDTYGCDKAIAFLGNVMDQNLLAELMCRYKVQTVYHAAAYKHVPLVEYNVVMGYRNNVLGTQRAALAAKIAKVEQFTLISTDKAVRPTNFMGATKRLAELIIQDLSLTQDAPTRFSMVRFGNVLGSSGSVVPLFKRQIMSGGPVTVTHPDITRYFMTIPEAVQLVIQASAMGRGGDVFLLDMGKPVKIAKLAETMILLMGKSVQNDLNPGGEISIEYHGLRPGEKLYEELLIDDNCVGTMHPMITKAMETFLPSNDLKQHLQRLLFACEVHDHDAIIRAMKNCVTGYQPEPHIHDHLYAKSDSRENIVKIIDEYKSNVDR